jgi:hypothetical protein
MTLCALCGFRCDLIVRRFIIYEIKKITDVKACYAGSSATDWPSYIFILLVHNNMRRNYYCVRLKALGNHLRNHPGGIRGIIILCNQESWSCSRLGVNS